MEENTQFDMVELKLPYLDYSTNSGEISFISGYGIQTGLHPRNGGGWMMAS
ncbi:hypothetical protein [Clostridium sp. ZS1]|nr:hypothetical protein [Clostridium sp. ZS1]